MDIFDDILDSGAENKKEFNLLLEELNNRFPLGKFQLISYQDPPLSVGTDLKLSAEIRKSLVEKTKTVKGIIDSELPDKRVAYAIAVHEMDASIIFVHPGQGDGPSLENYGTAAVQLCIDLFFAEKKLREDQSVMEVYKNQMERKSKSQEEKFHEILEESRVAYVKLEEFSRLQQALLDTAATAIYTLDPEQLITQVNEEFCVLTGYDKKEVIGRNISILGEEGNGTKDEEEINKIQTKIRTKDGGELRVIKNVGSIKDLSGRSIGMVESFVDVTHLIRAREAAEAANIAKRDFLANMSHEMRTPLNGIIGMAELAMEATPDANILDILHTINYESNSLNILINDILDFAKIETGKIELEEHHFDLRIVMEDVASSMAIRAVQKQLEFISFLSPDVPHQLIGDSARLRQIFVNLIGNAVKFTTEGEIFVRADSVGEENDMAKVRFSIKDTGIGIPKDKQEKIFEGFTQADSSTTRKFGGTGLGTTISKMLVEEMKGEIGLDSEEGMGSTFWFSIPFVKQTKQLDEIPPEEVDLAGKTVMVVDDNRTNRFIMSEYLKTWGSLPVEAASGVEALTLLKDSAQSGKSFTLILLDVQMPGMDGFELAQKIRAIKRLKDIPILIVSSVGNIGDGEKCREIGIEGYFTKPVKKEDMRKGIISVLGGGIGEKEQEVAKLVTRHTIAEENRKNIQILLVDDYPTNRKVGEKYLTSAGYQVDLAENGEVAVAAYKRKQYDLIFMDMQMPIMDGYEAMGKIRAHESELASEGPGSSSHISIVALTAHAMKGDRERCLNAGADDYLTKPMKKKSLLEIVDKWLAVKAVSKKEPDDKPEKETPTTGAEMENEPPMNTESVLDEYDGDREFMMEVLNDFLKQVEKQVGIIREAITEQDSEQVRKEAHAIKGGSGLLTANDLSGVALELENIGKSGSLEGSKEVLERLEREFQRLAVFAKNL